jgi:hypothetical protein
MSKDSNSKTHKDPDGFVTSQETGWEITSDPIDIAFYTFLTNYYLYQDGLLWSRVHIGLTIEAALIAFFGVNRPPFRSKPAGLSEQSRPPFRSKPATP